MNLNDQELLQLVYKNAEMGRDGLDHLIERTEDRDFRRTLAEQFAEYQFVMDEARTRLDAFGQEPKGSSTMAVAMLKKLWKFAMEPLSTVCDMSSVMTPVLSSMPMTIMKRMVPMTLKRM